jgi:hypothetical protein
MMFFPTAAQLELLSSPSRRICYRHANKVGGTSSSLYWLAEHMLGRSWWRDVAPAPCRAIILTPTWTSVRHDLTPYLLQHLPAHMLASHYNPEPTAIHGGWPGGEVRLTNGSSLLFRVMEGVQARRAGFGADVVMINEPPTAASYNEIARALGANPHGGYLLINAAMVGRDMTWLRAIVEPDGQCLPPPDGTVYHRAAAPGWVSLQVGLDASTTPWLSDEARKLVIASFAAHELRQRVGAEWDGMAMGAMLYMFDDTCLGSWLETVGDTQRALRAGWQFGLGLDHGIGARREAAALMAWHPRLLELWWLDTYRNEHRTTEEADARGIRAMLDRWQVPIRAVTMARGDVGQLGKGSVDASSINQALSRVRTPSGSEPVLGFPIATARKGPGSVADGVNEMNRGFASGAFKVDRGNAVAREAIVMWSGGETHKDVCDAGRYLARDVLEMFRMGRGGLKGG